MAARVGNSVRRTIPGPKLGLDRRLKRAMAGVALVLSTSLIAPATALGASAAVCADETYSWGGTGRLDPVTTSVDTGISVPDEAGTTIDVVGHSADGLSDNGTAVALSMSVGGTSAVPGARVPGGAVVLHSDGSTSVEVRGATLVVTRCTAVQSFAADPPLPRAGSSIEVGGSLFGVVSVAIGSAMIVAGRRRRPSN